MRKLIQQFPSMEGHVDYAKLNDPIPWGDAFIKLEYCLAAVIVHITSGAYHCAITFEKEDDEKISELPHFIREAWMSAYLERRANNGKLQKELSC